MRTEHGCRPALLAIDCREFVPGRITGIGRFLQNILQEIGDNRPHLATVVLAEPDSPIPVIAPHISTLRLSSPFTLHYDQILLPRTLRALGSAVFFSPYYKAPLAAPCPTVITIHDLTPLQFAEYSRGGGRFYAAAFKRWAALIARRAAAVITDSEFSKQQILAEMGLPPHQIHVFHLGVGEEFLPTRDPSAASRLTSRYGIDGDYLFALGNFLPHKNFSRLVEAYSGLPESLRARVKLVLAGSPGGHGPAISADLAALAQPGVLLPGFIAAEDLPILYSMALAVVCASLMEGFGYAPLEAMACGTPIVCSHAGALPEVAGDAALYFDPTNVREMTAAVEQILTDETLRQNLAARGLARAQLFAPAQTTARLVDLLEAVIARGNA